MSTQGYRWEVRSEGRVVATGRLEEGERIVLGPTGIRGDNGFVTTPWHVRLAVSSGRLLAASADAQAPAKIGPCTIPVDFVAIAPATAILAGSVELRLWAIAASAQPPVPGDEATRARTLDELSRPKRTASDEHRAFASAPSTGENPLVSPGGSGGLARSAERQAAHAAKPVEQRSPMSDESLMTRVSAPPAPARAHVAHGAIHDAHEGARVAHGRPPCAEPGPVEHTPTQAPPAWATQPFPPAGYAQPQPTAPGHAGSQPPQAAHAAPQAHGAHPSAPPFAIPLATPASATATARSSTPKPATSKPRRSVVIVASAALAVSLALVALSGARRTARADSQAKRSAPTMVTTSTTAAAGVTASVAVGGPEAAVTGVDGVTTANAELTEPGLSTGTEGGPERGPGEVAPRAPTEGRVDKRTIPVGAARAERDVVGERRLAQALIAGDTDAALAQADTLVAAHPKVNDYRMIRRALRRAGARAD